MFLSRANTGIYQVTQNFLRKETNAEEAMVEIIKYLRAADLPIEANDSDISPRIG